MISPCFLLDCPKCKQTRATVVVIIITIIIVVVVSTYRDCVLPILVNSVTRCVCFITTLLYQLYHVLRKWAKCEIFLSVSRSIIIYFSNWMKCMHNLCIIFTPHHWGECDDIHASQIGLHSDLEWITTIVSVSGARCRPWICAVLYIYSFIYPSSTCKLWRIQDWHHDNAIVVEVLKSTRLHENEKNNAIHACGLY